MARTETPSTSVATEANLLSRSKSVRDMCSRVCVLEYGRKVFDGPVDEGLERYQQSLAADATPQPA